MRLYPNCKPVTGYTNVALCDLERQRFKVYPKDQFFKRKEQDPSQPFGAADISEQGLIFLKENKFLISDESFFMNQQIKESLFYQWKTPSLITNTVMELSDENGLLKDVNFTRIIRYLEALLCKQVVLVLKKTVPIGTIMQLMNNLHGSNIHSIQLVLPYTAEYYTDAFGTLILSHPKIQFVILESSPFEKNIENKIFFTTKLLETQRMKKPDQFVTNVFLFSESQLHHTYFNRKLYISAAGEIKNAPECADNFGRIQKIKKPEQLIELIKTKAFQKYWYIVKERCEVCKDCEFRHICIDNRVPHQRENGYWYHLQECNYDPYTGKWNEESLP